ncbi:MAG: DUF4010 domain-containing protein [Acidiphilium sp.]|nr:DUF4010 domain-containing protein [Acidiphilium sp.]MDD4934491.1 DUF4010 domain-containing protein [Acidiphilium sp.]
MTSTLVVPHIVPWLLILGLSFFFGLAFEEFHARAHHKRPGGVRSFPLLATVGGSLYQLDPAPPFLLGVGLLGLSTWLALYYWHGMAETSVEGLPNVGLMAPICNVIAYLIGPIAIAGPPWMAIGVTVAAVLLLTARETLHKLAQRIELFEIVNAGRYLLLTGLVLPLLSDKPVTTLTTITPYQIWLAMVAVSTISYASYLLRRYVVPTGSGLLVAILGGIYSSTVTTIVLARRARTNPETRREAQSGIVLANAVMYLRLLIVIALFDRGMALALAPWMVSLTAAGALLAFVWYRFRGAGAPSAPPIAQVANPLGLGTAATFATLFVVVSILATFVMRRFGSGGVYSLAGIIGITDINPFVLSLAQHSTGVIPTPVGAAAVLIATSSNNVFQSIYASAYSGGKTGLAPVAGLLLLAIGGLAAAYRIG